MRYKQLLLCNVVSTVSRLRYSSYCTDVYGSGRVDTRVGSARVGSKSAADLGMFGMFGRTGARTKRGPHKRSGKFFMPAKMGDSRVKREWWAKKGRQFLKRTDSWHATVMTKKVPIFSGKMGSAAPVEGSHIFSEQGPAESKSCPGQNCCKLRRVGSSQK